MDTHGNTGTTTRTVIVQDTIAPVLYLIGSGSETVEASTGIYLDQ